MLAEFAQRWSLREVLVGDLASTLTLAPGEVLTVEVRRTDRTLIEEGREQASTVEEAAEIASSDKEALTVANTSARASNWSIAGGGSFSLGSAGVSANATSAATISNTLASTVNEVHETTIKSSQKIATQSKIQVRGVTEGTVESRQTRILRNPFLDRTLGLNLYEISKRFRVMTEEVLIRPLVIAEMAALDFTDPASAQSFIASNAQFLSEQLIDIGLRESLPVIVESIRQLGAARKRREEQQARLDKSMDDIEEYLFGNRAGWQPYHHSNYEQDIIAGDLAGVAVGAFNDGTTSSSGERPAARDAEIVGADALQIFLALHSIYTIRTAGEFSNAEFKIRRLELFRSLAKFVGQLWSTNLSDSSRKALLDTDSMTELFRRIPGFLCLTDGLLVDAEIPQPEDPKVTALISALGEHLHCHRHFYTEQYLRFLWGRLGRTFVVRLVNSLLHTVYNGVPVPPAQPDIESFRPFRNMYRVEDVQFDGLSVLIPIQRSALPDLATGNAPSAGQFAKGLEDLAKAIQGATKPPPRIEEILVTADGLHIDPIAGKCVLPLCLGSGSDGGPNSLDDYGRDAPSA
ncbi:hypothetical protein [Pseudonocardia lacus]|uniref:hypothetical protein n=1 Tax=Pseudonocardia lacus TaxID=2835865 RepID=UPI001BDD89E9|nr:hypothetical protein [Pseudonocardia lacus]